MGVWFTASGDLVYTVETNRGKEEKVVSARQNYALEVEQFGRCILEGEERHVTKEFSRKNAKVVDEILKAIQY